MTSPGWAAITQILSEETYDFNKGTAHHFIAWNFDSYSLLESLRNLCALGKGTWSSTALVVLLERPWFTAIVPNECVSNHMNGKPLWVVL